MFLKAELSFSQDVGIFGMLQLCLESALMSRDRCVADAGMKNVDSRASEFGFVIF